MHPDLAAFIDDAALTPDLTARLVALFEQHGQPALTNVSDYESVVLQWSDLATLTPDREETREHILPVQLADRYLDLGPIGVGGMAEVRRVRDFALNRNLAMKTIHPRLVAHEEAISRFLEEAQATAQLQHPNIVPIHDIGALPDGRVWFTMKEIRGRTMTAVAAEVRAASATEWRPSDTGWTFKRIVAGFLAVCNAVAYAHERGVIHRDLKPDNVMVGTHGETYVLDWGLAKIVGRPSRDDFHRLTDLHPAHLLPDEETVQTSGSHVTEVGAIAGTPAYMAPEQAVGDLERMDQRTDVYALGALLYEILCGRAPYEGTGRQALSMLLQGPPVPVVERAPANGPALPDELVEICERAMAREPEDRFASALALASAVEAWLDGANRREQALVITERALEGVGRAKAMLAQADELEQAGEAQLAQLARWQSEDDKAEAWAMQDQAVALRAASELEQLNVDQGLHGALRVAPDLPEAHAALAERYRARHAVAEAARDTAATARAQSLVQLHAQSLPASHPTRDGCATYLRGDGALSLVTDPPGAEVMLYRYELHRRRLIEVPQRSLGATPLEAVSLPMGSYLCVLNHPDCEPVRYPVEVSRLGHWDGIAPGDSEPTPIWLPPRGTLGDDVYVPAGWFRSGGDPLAGKSFPARRLWCDALVMQRFQVTNRHYLAFLDDLVAQGRLEDALRWAPHEAGREKDALIYGFDGTNFSIQPDGDGDVWLLDYPVLMIDWPSARAYLDWLAARSGRPWRLPAELEWEKAARGVDGRWFPMGDFVDPSWCVMTDSHPDGPHPSVVDSHPIDVSPYGVRGMGGNVYDWCMELFTDTFDPDQLRVPPPDPAADAPARALRVGKGGNYFGSERTCRVASRHWRYANVRNGNLGFRGMYRP